VCMCVCVCVCVFVCMCTPLSMLVSLDLIRFGNVSVCVCCAITRLRKISLLTIRKSCFLEVPQEPKERQAEAQLADP
jgi:hypothetical protein